MVTLKNDSSDILIVDFESYYDDECSVTTLGPVAYTQHPRFEAYLVSLYDGEGEPWVGNPRDVNWYELQQRYPIWGSVNSQFDQEVARSLFPNFPMPNYWADIAAMGAFRQMGRSLADMMWSHDKTVVDKGVRTKAKGKTVADMKSSGLWNKMLPYSAADARYPYVLWKTYSDQWPQHERELSDLTIRWATRGIHVDESLVDYGVEMTSLVRWHAEQKIPWRNNEDEKLLSAKALGKYCKSVGIEPPSTVDEDSEEFDLWCDTYSENREAHDVIEAMRSYRKANTLYKKVSTIKRRTINGIFSYSLKYCGAMFTKRWSGDGGVNLQNLPRKPWVPAMEIPGKTFTPFDLRKCFLPRPGKKMVTADCSQIEARVLAYLAGQEELLNKIRSGFAVYEAHARATMGWNAGKLKDENPELYSLAKARVLGLGYGCGAAKFKTVAKIMAGLDLDELTCKRIVRSYRSTNIEVKELWDRLQRDLKNSMGENFEMQLPNGDIRRYFNVEASQKKDEETGHVRRGFKAVVSTGKTDATRYPYGGLLTENLCQATARDILSEHLLKIDSTAGMDGLFHVHDEAIVEVDESDAAEAARYLEEMFSKPPEWMPELPVGSEVKILSEYTK